MSTKRIERELIRILKDVQAEGGYDDAATISSGTCPLDDLEGFDSLLIPQVVRELARDLGQPFKKGQRVSNVFVSGKKKLTVRQIAEQFQDKYLKKEAAV